MDTKEEPAVEQPMPAAGGHNALSPMDPDNPQNWPLRRKIYASSMATAFTFAVTFGLTAYTAGIPGIMAHFNVSMQIAVLGFSLPIFGIFFAPIYTPHLSERYGRVPIYLTSLPLFALFILGSGFAQNFATVAVCRFFAGLFGGPIIVLIEGTYAEIWEGKGATVTYYSALTLASFIGTACGKCQDYNNQIFSRLSQLRSTHWRFRFCREGLALAGMGHSDDLCPCLHARNWRSGDLWS